MATADYEQERRHRIEDNRRRMEEMGLLKQVTILQSFRTAAKLTTDRPKAGGLKKFTPRVRHARVEKRRSARLAGGPAAVYAELDEDGVPIVVGPSSHQALDDDNCALIDLMDRSGYTIPESQQEDEAEVQARRCASQGRGSTYDSVLGITCHFCRQKKLCGEADCRRCAFRDSSQECVGKTNCSRCQSATGRFCRACLSIRYGQDMSTVRCDGEWLCPHCYEEEHGEACGWICNSSICMKRRGLAPTGIAIYEAQGRGFKSVAHYLQAQLQKRGGAGSSSQASGASDDTALAASGLAAEAAQVELSEGAPASRSPPAPRRSTRATAASRKQQ